MKAQKNFSSYFWEKNRLETICQISRFETMPSIEEEYYTVIKLSNVTAAVSEMEKHFPVDDSVLGVLSQFVGSFHNIRGEFYPMKLKLLILRTIEPSH